MNLDVALNMFLQGSIPDPLPMHPTPPLLPATTLTSAKALAKQELSSGLSQLRQLDRYQLVEVIWTDNDGTQDWFEAKILKVKLTHTAKKTAGALVGYLDESRKVSAEEFIPVRDLERRLRLHGGSDSPPEAEAPEAASTKRKGKVKMHFCVHCCTHIHTYIQGYKHTYMEHTYTPSYTHGYIHTYTHTYIHTYIHTYRHAYMHTYIHIYIHTYIHTYRHIYRGTY